MPAKIKVFVDSNVVVASLLSPTGAARALRDTTYITGMISSLSIEEITRTAARLGLDKKTVSLVIDENFDKVNLDRDLIQMVKKYEDYVRDENDAHVVAGAVIAKAKFLITHNTKHFNLERIKRELNILTMTPGQFLQYLRSLK